jgi:hypothetical protein
MSVVLVTAYNFQVMVSLLASRMLGGSSELYRVVMSSLGLGAVTGSLLIASRVKPGVMMVGLCCGLLSIVHIWLTLPFGVFFALADMFLLGVSCGFFTLQLRAPYNSELVMMCADARRPCTVLGSSAVV